MKLEILYENNDILVINKPHNLSTIPTKAHFDNNLCRLVCEYLNDPNFVFRAIYRLDKDTAGIIFVAKTIEGYHNIKILSKEYFALCEGVFDKREFDIDKPILTETIGGKNQMKRVISNDGKPAQTHCEVVKNFENYSLVKCTLKTGRTHQIRVHLSSENHPLVGDPIYNNKYTSQYEKSHSFLLLKKVVFQIDDTPSQTIEVDYPAEWKDLLK